MSLFKGPVRQHTPGHKELSDYVGTMEIKAGSKVFIPLIYGPSVNLEILVKEGDHASIGTKVAQCNGHNVVPIFASVSGTVADTQKPMHFFLKPVEHFIIENDGLYERVRPLEPFDYKNADRTALINFMMDAGIIGLGGAGFPTYIKYKSAKDVRKLIINAVECEPSITADFKMTQAHKEESVIGVVAMKKMAMASEAVAAIKKTHPDLIQFVEEAVKSMEGFSVAATSDVYPMGWERVLAHEIMHAEYEKLPGEVGTIVNNTTTVIAFGGALLTGTSTVSKTPTASGNAIKEPTNVQVSAGVPVPEIAAACGGYTCEDVRLIAGGPMMGKMIVNDKFVIDCSMNALTILENKPFDSIACPRCGKCPDHCSAGLQPVCITQAVGTNDKKAMEKLCAMGRIECGPCTYICPSRLDVTGSARRAKRQLTLAKK